MPSLEMTRNKMRKGREHELGSVLTVGKENGEKFEMIWAVNILQIICTGLCESSPVENPAFAVAEIWMRDASDGRESRETD